MFKSGCLASFYAMMYRERPWFGGVEKKRLDNAFWSIVFGGSEA